MARALVTGGAGFIGSNLVDALLEQGHEVTIVDDFSTGKEENVVAAREAGAVVERLSIVDRDALAGAFGRARPELVFHLAAQIDVRKSITDTALDARTNVEGTVSVLQAALDHGVRRVVNTSTGGAIYGETDVLPTPENTPPQPKAPYGNSKLCAETYVELFRRLHGLSTVTLRYGNVYGPRQDPLGEAGVIAIFCGKLKAGGTPVVFGDGRQTRDYVYVDDVVAANLAAAGSETSGAFNIGTGEEVSVLDLIEALREVAGADGFEPDFRPARRGEVERSCIDVTRAREELGWSARTLLRDGLATTLETTTV